MLKLATLSWVENGEIKGGERRQRQVDTFGIGGRGEGEILPLPTSPPINPTSFPGTRPPSTIVAF